MDKIGSISNTNLSTINSHGRTLPSFPATSSPTLTTIAVGTSTAINTGSLVSSDDVLPGKRTSPSTPIQLKSIKNDVKQQPKLPPTIRVNQPTRRSSSLKLQNGANQQQQQQQRRYHQPPSSLHLTRCNTTCDETDIDVNIECQQPLLEIKVHNPSKQTTQQQRSFENFTNYYNNNNNKSRSDQQIESAECYIDDYITPEMNYKDNRKSPPIHHNDPNNVSWDKDQDNISLYGTPKEEMMPGLGDAKGPSFMRSQIEALFQPSGKSLFLE